MIGLRNNHWATMRSCVACWHMANRDATNTRYRNIGTAAGASAAALTLNEPGSTADPSRVAFIGTNFLWGSQVNGNGATMADNAAIRPVGDMALEVDVALTSYAPAAAYALYFHGTANNSASRNFYLFLNTDGKLNFSRPTSAGAARLYTTTSALGFTAGARKRLRIKYDQDNGSAVSEVVFQESDNGTDWTTIDTKTNASTADGLSNTGSIYVGQVVAGLSPFSGKVHRVRLWSNKDATGSAVLDFNGASGLTQAAWSNSGTAGGSATINRSATGTLQAAVMTGGVRAIGKFDGVDDYLSATSASQLNLGTSTSATAFALVRRFGTAAAYSRVLAKHNHASPYDGYVFYSNNTGLGVIAAADDGPNVAVTAATSDPASGTLELMGFVLDRNAQTLAAFAGNTLTSTASTSSVGDLDNAYALTLGRESTSAVNQMTGEIAAAGLALRPMSTNALLKLKGELRLFQNCVA